MPKSVDRKHAIEKLAEAISRAVERCTYKRSAQRVHDSSATVVAALLARFGSAEAAWGECVRLSKRTGQLTRRDFKKLTRKQLDLRLSKDDLKRLWEQMDPQ